MDWITTPKKAFPAIHIDCKNLHACLPGIWSAVPIYQICLLHKKTFQGSRRRIQRQQRQEMSSIEARILHSEQGTSGRDFQQEKRPYKREKIDLHSDHSFVKRENPLKYGFHHEIKLVRCLSRPFQCINGALMM